MKLILCLVVIAMLVGAADALRMKRNADFDSVKLNRWLASRMKREVSEAVLNPDLMDTMMMEYIVRRLEDPATKREGNKYMNKRAPKWRW